MKLPKCEIVLPRGYRWVKKGKRMRKADLVVHPNYGSSDEDPPFEWTNLPRHLCFANHTAPRHKCAIRRKTK